LTSVAAETLRGVSTPQTGISPRQKLVAILEERLALIAPSRRLRLAQSEGIVERHAPDRPLRVLDAGCGDGLLSLAIAKRHRGWSVLGIDLDPGLLAGARDRARARALANVEFEPADLTRELAWGNFDVVLALECLTEIPDDDAALGAMSAALAPGGLLVAQVPSDSWKPVLPGSASIWRKEVRHGYDPEELGRALRQAGLGEVEIRPTFHTATMVAQEIRDRIKNSSLIIRALAFPFMVAAAWLERSGLRLGRPNALLANARRPG